MNTDKEILKARILLGVLMCGPLLGQELVGQIPTPEPTPLEIPANVDVFEVVTSSSENRRVPFYLRKPQGFDPANRDQLHRILFICPVYNGDGLKVVQGGGLLDLADERGWCVLVPTFKMGSDVRDRRTAYYYPETWSGRAVLAALQQIERKYPNIWTEDILMQGLSGGAQFVHRFAIWAPDRVAAVAVNSSSWFDAPNSNSGAVGWLVTVGESDQTYSASLDFHDQLVAAGAVPVFRSYLGMVHEGDARVNRLTVEFLKFFDEHSRERIGRRRSAMERQRLQPALMPEQTAFVGDMNDWSILPNTPENAEYVPEDARIFLPDEAIAERWKR